jgi:hypothetical protein
MQGSFDFPNDAAEQVKAKCAETFDSFQLQAVCMDNEKRI